MHPIDKARHSGSGGSGSCADACHRLVDAPQHHLVLAKCQTDLPAARSYASSVYGAVRIRHFNLDLGADLSLPVAAYRAAAARDVHNLPAHLRTAARPQRRFCAMACNALVATASSSLVLAIACKNSVTSPRSVSALRLTSSAPLSTFLLAASVFSEIDETSCMALVASCVAAVTVCTLEAISRVAAAGCSTAAAMAVATSLFSGFSSFMVFNSDQPVRPDNGNGSTTPEACGLCPPSSRPNDLRAVADELSPHFE
jgi:hypothetical protein